MACARSRPRLRARRQAPGAFAAQKHVGRVGHGARQQDGIAHVAHAGDRAEAPARIHDRGVRFDGHTVQAEDGAGAGIEARVFFEHQHGGNRGVERFAGFLESCAARLRRLFASVHESHGFACAAMGNDGESIVLLGQFVFLSMLALVLEWHSRV